MSNTASRLSGYTLEHQTRNQDYDADTTADPDVREHVVRTLTEIARRSALEETVRARWQVENGSLRWQMRSDTCDYLLYVEGAVAHSYNVETREWKSKLATTEAGEPQFRVQWTLPVKSGVPKWLYGRATYSLSELAPFFEVVDALDLYDQLDQARIIQEAGEDARLECALDHLQQALDVLSQ